MPDLADWRARLRLAVELSGRKHSIIAEDAGITPTTLSRILNGWHARPAFESIVGIAHAAGESVGWILHESRAPLSAEETEKMREIAKFLVSRFPKKNPP
jgi:transcriptional regulator with XRE-family HTH domain